MLNKKRIRYCTCPKCKYRDVDRAFRMTREEAGRLNGLKAKGIKKGTGKRAKEKALRFKQTNLTRGKENA